MHFRIQFSYRNRYFGEITDICSSNVFTPEEFVYVHRAVIMENKRTAVVVIVYVIAIYIRWF